MKKSKSMNQPFLQKGIITTQSKSHIEYMLEGYEIEWQSKSILTKENFTIIYYDSTSNFPHYINLLQNGFYLQDLKNKGIDIGRLLSNHLDYLCERKGKYFIVDVKSKHLSNDRTKNYFYVTRDEINTINYYENSKHIVVKILVVLKKGESLLYKFFNWNNFILPKGYFKGKYKNTVRVRLKHNIDLSRFKTLELHS